MWPEKLNETEKAEENKQVKEGTLGFNLLNGSDRRFILNASRVIVRNEDEINEIGQKKMATSGVSP